MDNSNFKTERLEPMATNASQKIKDTASELLDESKKMASDLYKQGMDKVNDAEEKVQEYSDLLMSKIHDNPLTSVLIAVGAGLLLSALFKRK